MFNSFIEMCNQFQAHKYYRRVLWDFIRMYLIVPVGRDVVGVIDINVRIQLNQGLKYNSEDVD
jgi:hypothetical protein